LRDSDFEETMNTLRAPMRVTSSAAACAAGWPKTTRSNGR
jgi:hypothetical protein